MAFASRLALAHGLGAITFGGVFKLANGKFILFESGGTSIWEMVDEVTPAVLIHTATFALFQGAAGRHIISALDRIVIAGNESYCYVEYDAFDVALVAEQSLSGVFVGENVTKVAFGGGLNEFFVVGTNLAADYIQLGNPIGATGFGWVAGALCISTLRELPGRPISMNSWGLQAALPVYDATDLAAYTFGGTWMTFLESLLVTQNRPLKSFYRGKPGVWIAGAEGGWISTDVAGQFQAALRNILGVSFTDLFSLYLIAEESDGVTDLQLWSSPDGLTWTLSGLATGVLDTGVTPDRSFFASLVTNNFFVYNLQPTDAFPDTRWWVSPDGLNWTLKDASLPGILLGFYSNGGAGPTEIIKIDAATGDIFWSADEGVSFTGPVVGLIPAANAPSIRWIQETPTGLIAWGTDGSIFESTYANLHTTAWTDRSFTGGSYIGERHLRVTDAGDLVLHSRFQPDTNVVTKENHWETWENFGPGWALKDSPEYLLNEQVGIQFEDIYAKPGSLGRGVFIGAIGFGNTGAQQVVGFFTTNADPGYATWLHDIDPEQGIITRGYKNLIVLAGDNTGGDPGRIKYVPSVTFNAGTTTSRQLGWAESAEKFVDELGTQQNVVQLFCDGDVMVVMGPTGIVATSADASQWAPVLNDPELQDGHHVVS